MPLCETNILILYDVFYMFRNQAVHLQKECCTYRLFACKRYKKS